MNMETVTEKAVLGSMLGTAVGDALGLPCENLSPSRIRKLFPDLNRYHFLPGIGMVSDDTEHTLFTAQSLIASHRDPDQFIHDFAWRLRFWLACIPAGTGFATLRAILKLYIGFSPQQSGIFSAGNGPAMRAPILGVVFGHDPILLKTFVRRSTIITHTDPKAFHGALAVALAASMAAGPALPLPGSYHENLKRLLSDENAEEFFSLIQKALNSAEQAEPVTQFAETIGCRKGISGYIFHTVPSVLQVWFRKPDDFAGAIREIVAAGGDTDTTAAILGGIIGARVGMEGIPSHYLVGIREWPRSRKWMGELGKRLCRVANGEKNLRNPPCFYPGIPIRNLFFLAIVLFHGFRRLAPPY